MIAAGILGFVAPNPSQAARAQHGWIEVFPLKSGAPPRLVRVPITAAYVALAVRIDEVSMLCSGTDVSVPVCALRQPGAEVVRFTTTPGRAVIGKVQVDGRNVAGAAVALFVPGLPADTSYFLPLEFRDGELPRMVETDVSGRFVLPPVAPGTYALEVRIPNGRTVHPAEFTVEALGEPLDLGALDVAEGASVDILVTDVAGQPVADANITLWQGKRPPDAVLAAAATDAAGSAHVTMIEPDLPLRATCAAAGFIADRQEFESPPGLIEFVLRKAGTIRGRVVQASDFAPLPGARLESGERSAVAGQDGRFELGGVPPGRTTLSVRAPGFLPSDQDYFLSDGQTVEIGDIEVARARERTCHVRRGGRGVAGARVVSLEPEWLVDATTDASGEFALPLLPGRGSTRLSVVAPESPRSTFAIDAEAQECSLDLRPGGRIHVTVENQETDGPCQGCDLYVQSLESFEMLSLTTTAQGDVTSDLLEPGSYLVGLVEQVSQGSVTQVSGGGNTRRARVSPGAVTEVHFARKPGKLRVSFEPPLPSGWRLFARSGRRSEALAASHDGSFEVRRDAGESVGLFLSNLAGLEVRVAVLGPEDRSGVVRIPLPPSELRLSVSRDGTPAGEVRTELMSATGELIGVARSGPAGELAFPYITPGTYQLALAGRPFRLLSVGDAGVTELGDIALP